MPGGSWAWLAGAGLVLSAATALAQAPGNQGAAENVRQSRQYESLLCSNPGFRAKRIAQECGPVTDPQLHQSCLASFECGSVRRGSQKAPPSVTIR